MNKLVVYQYINKIKKEDIIKYGLKQGIVINDEETNLIYNYIKEDYERIINKPLEVINEIRDKISDVVYQKILELYDKYKKILDSLK